MSRNNKIINNIYITAVLPAHNEENHISKALASIYPYVSHIIVACDNCSDKTYQTARKYGADDVFNTINNHYRKAGALNQALENHVDWNIKNQYLLIMDADTVVVNPKHWFSKATQLVYPNRPILSREASLMSRTKRHWLKFIDKNRYNRLFKNHAYDCVGSIFQAPRRLKKHNCLTEGQRVEWQSFASQISRDRRVFVLTGTCSMISANKFLEIKKHFHHFYDKNALTEDFHLTLDLKTLHARMISPVNNMCITATKNSIKELIHQRTRWYAGAIQALSFYRINRVSLRYWLQQIGLFISVFAFLLFILVSVYLYLVGSVELTLFWTIVFIGYDLDMVLKDWQYSTWIDRLYTMSAFPLLYYSFILQIAYVKALVICFNHKDIYWNASKQSKEQ